jgi:hypothetical protein
MRTKRVNRYNCAHCNKRGYSAPHMVKHEKHCTMNPDRQCRVCILLGVGQVDLGDLVAMLPDPANYTNHEMLIDDANEAAERVRGAARCPMCTFAAIRQSAAFSVVTDFDFKAEMKAMWDEINDREAQECQHG